MSYRCPLCTLELRETDVLRLVCLSHDVAENGVGKVHEVKCKPDELKKLKCKTKTKGCRVGFWEGTFLSHVGCSVKHPWYLSGSSPAVVQPRRPKSQRIPSAFDEDDDGSSTRPEISTATMAPNQGNADTVQMVASNPDNTEAILAGQNIRHPMIAALLQLPKSHPEMWFPLPMLKAMQQNNSTSSAVVQISGSAGAGKTVLSLQSQHKLGYRVPGQDHLPAFDLENYVHMSDASCLVNAYEYLAAANDLAGGVSPKPTRAILDGIRGSLGDVKAVFFKLPDTPDKQGGSGWLQSYASALGIGQAPANLPWAWQTLMLFDVPGEMVENTAPIVGRISQAAHRVAIVVSASDLLTDGDGETLKVAQRELSRLRKSGRPKDTCIVITQLDKAEADLPPGAWESVKQVAASGKGGMKLLKTWLKAPAFRHKDLADLFLASLGGNKIPVFFVWTIGVDASSTSSKAPSTYGLQPFVAWCLKQPMEVIFATRRDDPDD